MGAGLSARSRRHRPRETASGFRLTDRGGLQHEIELAGHQSGIHLGNDITATGPPTARSFQALAVHNNTSGTTIRSANVGPIIKLIRATLLMAALSQHPETIPYRAAPHGLGRTSSPVEGVIPVAVQSLVRICRDGLRLFVVEELGHTREGDPEDLGGVTNALRWESRPVGARLGGSHAVL